MAAHPDGNAPGHHRADGDAAPGDGDGYAGPATLTAGESRFAVEVVLRGHFQPIDGRYHWYGRIAADEELSTVVGSGRTAAVLATGEGSAPCELSDPDPWGRLRVTGVSAPPFATGITADPGTSTALAGPADDLPGHVRVAIIGAGFGGLGAGVRLRQAGLTDFVILERAGSVGGTWRDNSYPGCACDVPSHLYSFSFAPNPGWSRSFSRQREIWDYLGAVTDRTMLRRHIHFATEVESARWDTSSCQWQLRTSRGDLRADVLISAAGPLSEPALPGIPGLGSFPGEVFHSARWNHDCDLAGKRVALVGTGASAIQIAPEIQPEVGRLVLFQRTPAWVLPRRDRRISAAEKWLYRRLPPAQRLARLGIYLSREATVGAFVKRPGVLERAQRMALRHLERSVPDPALRAKLTPDYVMGCKRILLSSNFYPALTRPNVDVVTAGLAKVDGSRLIAQDGTAHEADVIIFATGFHATDMPIAQRIHGASGATLAQTWGGDMRALRGTTIPGFPNLCLVIGPNTGLGHNSMVHIIESQLAYIVDYLKILGTERVAALDARPGAQDRWCADIERRMSSTVWATGGCVSWYLNAAGRNPTLWPGSTLRFRRATRRVDRSEYDVIRAGTAQSAGVAGAGTAGVTGAGTAAAGGRAASARAAASARQAKRRPRALPATRQMTVTAQDGVRLNVEIHGPDDASLPTAVLIHGWTCSIPFWAPVIEALRGELRLIVYDQRGHGASGIPANGQYSSEVLAHDLASVLDSVLGEGQRAVLAGHSMGGMTVMAAALRESVIRRTSGVLLASTGFADLSAEALVLPLRGAPRLSAELHRLLLTFPAPMGGPTPVSRAMLRYMTLGPAASKELAAHNAAIICSCDRRARAAWGRVLAGLDLTEAVSSIDVPAQVLVGAADRLTPPVHARRIAGRLPRCEGLTELPGIGHMTPLEAPHVVADVIRKLATGEGARR